MQISVVLAWFICSAIVASCQQWKGTGRMRARGRHGEAHAAPGGLSLGGWLLRASCPACGLHAGQVRRLGCAGASVLNRHVFEVARFHVGQVGHVGHPTSNSKAYQRFSLPDMAFPMSGACRACRARPTSWGIMGDGWKAWAGCGPWEAWRDARHAGRPFPWWRAFPGIYALPVASIRGGCGDY